MIFSSTDLIFDTLVDTNKIFVSVKNYFTLRKFKDQSLIYLTITGEGQRERINLDLKIKTKHWNEKTKRLITTENEKINSDVNLILDSIEAKIFGIKTAYRLSERFLTPKKLRKELQEGMPRVSFLAFFKKALESEKKYLELGSYKRHVSVYRKLEKFNPDVTFVDIDHKYLQDFKDWCKNKGNASTTISANIASIKKFLGIAKNNGIKFRIELDEIKVGNTKGNRTALTQNELKKVYKYYCSEFINNESRLVLGYFLFACMTGMRISDIQNLRRIDVIDTQINFVSKKTKIDQSIILNDIAKKIVTIEPLLFEKKLTDQYLNRKLKTIIKSLDIRKKISFHTSRHTFATSYLRAGGKIEKLRLLLGHIKIETTMIYSSIVAAEANEDVFRLDDYLN